VITLQRLQTATLFELVQDARCGELSALSCLCDERARELISAFYDRFNSEADRVVLLREICHTGCTVPLISGTSLDSDDQALPTPRPPVAAFAEVCSYAGAKGADLMPLFKSLGGVVQPAINDISVSKLSWCGIFACYVMRRAGLPVAWKLGKGVQSVDPNYRIAIVRDSFQPLDYIVGGTFAHHKLISGVDTSLISVIEGNTPTVACYTTDRSTFETKHSGWVHFRLVPK